MQFCHYGAKWPSLVQLTTFHYLPLPLHPLAILYSGKVFHYNEIGILWHQSVCQHHHLTFIALWDIREKPYVSRLF